MRFQAISEGSSEAKFINSNPYIKQCQYNSLYKEANCINDIEFTYVLRLIMLIEFTKEAVHNDIEFLTKHVNLLNISYSILVILSQFRQVFQIHIC